MTRSGVTMCDGHVHGAPAPRASRFRRSYAIVVLAAIVVSGCSGLHPVGSVSVRNESRDRIMVRIEASGENAVVLSVPPWQSGECPVAAYGVGSRPVIVTVSAAGRVNPSVVGLPKNGPPPDFYIRVDSSGQIHFGGPVPAITGPCSSYPFYTQS